MDKLSLTGNNGGDVLEIKLIDTDNRDNAVIHLRVGHCCVMVIDQIVPIEFVTAMLVQAVLNAGSVEEALMSVNWPEDLLEKLIAKTRMDNIKTSQMYCNTKGGMMKTINQNEAFNLYAETVKKLIDLVNSGDAPAPGELRPSEDIVHDWYSRILAILDEIKEDNYPPH